MPLSPAAPPVRPTCKTCGGGRAGIDRSQQVTATPGRLQRVGSRLPWHSSPCWGPSIVHVYSVSLFAFHPFWVHHQPFFHQGLAIEAEGISHFAFPSHLVADDRATASAAGGSAEHWNHSSQSGRGNRGATQPRNTSAASLTQQQGVPLSLPQPRRKTLSRPSRDTVLRPNPRRKTEHERTGHCSLVPPFHSFRPDWSTPQSNTGDRQTSAVRHSNPSVVSPHNGASTRRPSHHLPSPMTD